MQQLYIAPFARSWNFKIMYLDKTDKFHGDKSAFIFYRKIYLKWAFTISEKLENSLQK